MSKISAYTELAEAPASTDEFVIVDKSDTSMAATGTTKKIQAQYLTISDASTTVKGKVELATNAETITGTDTVRAVTPSNISSAIASGRFSPYAADAGGDDTYSVTLDPVPAAYYAGMEVNFKPTTANTGACTLDVNGLGAKTIKKNVSSDLSTGDILAGQMVKVLYDGTNFQLVSTIPTSPSYAADAGASDAYAITIDGVTAYDTGKSYIFKANTVNTGAATLNINALGAKTIKKNKNQDLGDADIKAGQLVEVVYDGTDFQMQSQIGNGYCLAMQSRGSTQSIPNTTVTKLLTGTANKTIGDITNDTANSQITVNVAGFYRISVYFGFADSAVGEFRIPSIYKNTAFLWDFYMTKNTGAGGMRQTCQHYAQLAAGDDIDMRLYQNSGGNLNSLAGCYFVVERIGD